MVKCDFNLEKEIAELNEEAKKHLKEHHNDLSGMMLSFAGIITKQLPELTEKYMYSHSEEELQHIKSILLTYKLLLELWDDEK